MERPVCMLASDVSTGHVVDYEEALGLEGKLLAELAHRKTAPEILDDGQVIHGNTAHDEMLDGGECCLASCHLVHGRIRIAYDLRRVAGHDGVRWDVAGDDRPSTHHSSC